MSATAIQLVGTEPSDLRGIALENEPSRNAASTSAPAPKQTESVTPTAVAVKDPSTPRLDLKGITKIFHGETGEVVALQDVDLVVKPGEFISLLGASGCGKTTLLRIIGGLEKSYSGNALLDGRPIKGPGRDRGFVFQDHRLLPWLTVEENVGFGLAHLKKKERTEIVQSHIKLVGLEAFSKSYPSQLSGGMAQRASIARALATDPEILLLDEPLGALDALTRMYMQEEIEKIWQAKPGLTVIMVTHDVDEALYLSDRIVVLSPRPGRIKRIVDVGISRPRPREGQGFNAIKKSLLAEFHLSHKEAEPEFNI
jgi:ABC-type nitrate/sulfonate/bicarbonate transport system ATPase subunit